MDKSVYWVWLQSALGAGARTDELIATFPDAEFFYKSGEHEWRLSGVLTNRQIEKLSACPLQKAEGIVELCKNNGWQIITPGDEDYPEKLVGLKDPPLALYVDGDINKITDRICIAMVGARKATFEGTYIANRWAQSMALADICVVSGGAMGIDSASHTGSLQAGGITAAVLGCGFGVKYLMENEPMRRKIAQNGALITEFAPGTDPSVRTFPIRNRLIAALSDATVVVEAGLGSGSLITARCAMEQGRPVYAPPGDVLNSSYAGANELIRDGGRVIFSAFDVIEEYALRYPQKISDEGVEAALQFLGGKRRLTKEQRNAPPKTVTRPHKAAKKDAREHPEFTKQREDLPTPPFEVKKIISIPTDLSEKAKKVYAVFGDEALFADEIAKLSSMPSWEVVGALTELELNDLICLCAGKRYKKI